MTSPNDRKKEEQRPRDTGTRLQLLVRASSLGLWDWDLVTNEVWFSPEWKSQLGYADDELPNRYEEWEGRLHPDDRDAALAAVTDCIDGRRKEWRLPKRICG